MDETDLKGKFKVDYNKATIIIGEDKDPKKNVADMIALGFAPPDDMIEHLLNNPHLSEQGQKKADAVYKYMKKHKVST